MIRTPEEREAMIQVGSAVELMLEILGDRIEAGTTTADLDELASTLMETHGVGSTPKRLYEFPGAICVSVNEEAVHGVPSDRVIEPGDVVKIDVTVDKNGYIADAARTVCVPPVSHQAARLRLCAKNAFDRALGVIRAGAQVNDIGRAVEDEVTSHGFCVIRDLSGHGIGETLHEKPRIPNFYDERHSTLLEEGMVIAVEPVVAVSTHRIVTEDDGWTIRSADRSLTAHYENTILVTRDGAELLTRSS